MVGIIRVVVILEMARNAECAVQAVVVIRVAIRTLTRWNRVHAG